MELFSWISNRRCHCTAVAPTWLLIHNKPDQATMRPDCISVRSDFGTRFGLTDRWKDLLSDQKRLSEHSNECLTWSLTSSRLKRAENCDFQGGVTDRPTNRRTDRPSYRDARTHLKTMTTANRQKRSGWNFIQLSFKVPVARDEKGKRQRRHQAGEIAIWLESFIFALQLPNRNFRLSKLFFFYLVQSFLIPF